MPEVHSITLEFGHDELVKALELLAAHRGFDYPKDMRIEAMQLNGNDGMGTLQVDFYPGA